MINTFTEFGRGRQFQAGECAILIKNLVLPNPQPRMISHKLIPFNDHSRQLFISECRTNPEN